MRKLVKQAAAHVAEDKGFYIILVLCAAAIAISGYVLFFAPLNSGASMESTEYTAGPAKTEDVMQAAASLSGEETPAAEETEPPAEETEPAPSGDEPASSEPAAAPVWVRPVEGKVLQAFSGDDLVYQKTFGDWRVHAGTDYQASSGTRVYAVADGEVTEVTQDPLWGACVTVMLSDGRAATYRGLAEGPKAKKGSSVKAGDVIGSVAAVVPAEAETGSHVHLELRGRDGVTVDPEKK